MTMGTTNSKEFAQWLESKEYGKEQVGWIDWMDGLIGWLDGLYVCVYECMYVCVMNGLDWKDEIMYDTC